MDNTLQRSAPDDPERNTTKDKDRRQENMDKLKFFIIAAVGLVIVVLLAAAVAMLLIIRRRRKKNASGELDLGFIVTEHTCVNAQCVDSPKHGC